MPHGVATLEIRYQQKTNGVWFFFEQEGLPAIRIRRSVQSEWSTNVRKHYTKRLEDLFDYAFDHDKHRADEVSDILVSIGSDVWDLFPSDIQSALRRFDRMALDEEMQESGSCPVLIIKANVDCVPWDLCVIPSRYGARSRLDRAWYTRPVCFRFQTAIAHMGAPEPLEAPGSGRERILLLRELPTPEEAERHGNVDARYPDILQELDRLVQRLRGDGIQVDEDYAGNSNYKLLDKLKGRHAYQYDMIVFAGHYAQTGREDAFGKMEVRKIAGRDSRVNVSDIHPESHPMPALFLNACRTDHPVSERTILDASVPALDRDQRIACAKSLPGFFISRGASAFVGTRHLVEPDVSAYFTTKFLEAVFVRGLSLIRAVYDARQSVSNEFSSSEFKKIESALFTLHGNGVDLNPLINSFRFGPLEQPLRFIFTPVVEPYFEPVGRTLLLDGSPDFRRDIVSDFDEAMRTSANARDLFIADMPLLSAAKLVSDSRENDAPDRFKVVGSLFRVGPGSTDAYLYYLDDKAHLQDAFFFHSGYLSQVTAFAMSYWKKIGLLQHFSSVHRTSSYRQILDANLRFLTQQHLKHLHPFVLAGEYAQHFNQYLEDALAREDMELAGETTTQKTYRIRDGQGAVKHLVRVNLSDFFFGLCRASKAYGNLEFVPAEALLTRTSSYQSKSHVYREFFTRWTSWKRHHCGARQSQLGEGLVLDFKEQDREAMQLFTAFVRTELPGYVDGAELRTEDFLAIAPWDTELSLGDESVPTTGIPDKFEPLVVEAGQGIDVLKEMVKDLRTRVRKMELRKSPLLKEYQEHLDDAQRTLEEITAAMSQFRHWVEEQGWEESNGETVIQELKERATCEITHLKQI